MRNSFLAIATLGAAVLSASAFSQVSNTAIDATPYDISLKGGVYFPIDDNLRSVDNLFGGIGVEYLLRNTFIPNSETFFELDWLFHTTRSGSLNGFPLTINQRFYSKPGTSLFGHDGRSFFYLGGGVTWFDPHGQPKATFHGGIGSDLGPKTFVEASLYISDVDGNGLRNTGALVSIGYRF